MIVKILFIIGLIGLIIYIIKLISSYITLKRVSKDSLIVFGKKGKGKTFLFSVLARMNKKGYCSTTDFKHKNQLIVNYNDINVEPNNWESVLNGDVVQIEKREELEGKPVFLDDAGVYLPNFADSILKKQYDSLPVSLAVWRHLYNAPIHINSQDLSRCWKMVREQADGFIRVTGVHRHLLFSTIKFTYYDKYSSAEQCLDPMKNLLFNKFNKSEIELFKAQHGIIISGKVLAWNFNHRYDSRYFHQVFFGRKYQRKKRAKKAKK